MNKRANEKNKIAERLASRLKEEREAKGLSLAALSRLSGISRSMLSQIERRESSPTVASLWSLTQALNLDISSLLDSEADEKKHIIEIIRADDIPMIRNRVEGCDVRVLSPIDEVGGHEIYDISMEAGVNFPSQPHSKGCTEHLTVISGDVEVESGGERAQLKAGDTIRYAADVHHTVCSSTKARILIVAKYP